MTVEERLDRMGERIEGLIMTAELHQRELDALGQYIETDAENIRALARITEIHGRHREASEGSLA